MKKTNKTWVVVADAAGARLVECGSDAAGRCRVREQAALRAAVPPPHRGRPILTANHGHPASLENHQAEESLRRFAAQLTQWMLDKATEHDIDDLVLFAPSRFLGAMRRTPQRRLLPGLQERCEELSSMDIRALARHPQIRGLVSPTGQRSTVEILEGQA